MDASQQAYEKREPIYCGEDGKWYHFDEIWAEVYGPFDTKELCEQALQEYCDKYLGL